MGGTSLRWGKCHERVCSPPCSFWKSPDDSTLLTRGPNWFPRPRRPRNRVRPRNLRSSAARSESFFASCWASCSLCSSFLLTLRGRSLPVRAAPGGLVVPLVGTEDPGCVVGAGVDVAEAVGVDEMEMGSEAVDAVGADSGCCVASPELAPARAPLPRGRPRPAAVPRTIVYCGFSGHRLRVVSRSLGRRIGKN